MTNEEKALELLEIESSQRQFNEEKLTNIKLDNEFERHAYDIVKTLGLKPYRDGNEWCILWGENIQSGIFASAKSVNTAVCEFYKALFENLK